MNTRIASSLVFCLLALPALADPSSRPAIPFEDRVAAQRAIEEVYWNHRIWPQENPAPKPPLRAVLSDAALRAKVEVYLEESNALDQVWRRPVSAAELQAETDRITKKTRDPGMLGELFAALGNDPRLIAETLVRQTLVDRLVRGWYAYDDRFHGDVRRRAEAALSSCTEPGCMKSMGGRYVETTWRRGAGFDGSESEGRGGDRAAPLDPETWRSRLDRLARALGGTSSALLVNKLGRLQETADRFSVTAVLAQSADAVTTATVVWDKEPFDDWWASAGRTFGTVIDAPPGDYSLAAPEAEGCTFDTWEDTPDEVEPRTTHTAVWTGTEMIVWGGGSNSAKLDTGGRYNPSTDTWTATSRGPNAPSPRFGHTAVWTGREMIVWGGENDERQCSDSGGRYDPSTDSWSPILVNSGGSPDPRRSHVAVWTGIEMIVWGGYYWNGSNGVWLSTGGRYDPVAGSWQPTSTGSGVPVGRYFATAVWTGNEMIVWGGANGDPTPLTTGGRYDPAADSWQPTSTGAHAPVAGLGHSAVWTGSRMIIWGGDAITKFDNSGALYDPSTDTWQPTSLGAGVPKARADHEAVWTGSEMIVWGGGDEAFNDLNTGGRYDPVSDSWRATARSGAPAARDSHTAVWTGTEMIVWGGYAGELKVNSGGRYSPSTDSWVATSIPTKGQPAERDGHTTVWTGTEMIVWGGEFSDWSALRSGGRYAPVTDVWLPTPEVSSTPSPRLEHTAVWTGTEMIVWGGGGNGLVNTGGRYNPASDSWTATSTTGAPTARHHHTAVWTGTEMIVWGGVGIGGYFNTGGRYRPTSNSWTATSTTGAPSARTDHSAVWTGSEMIVWGGQNASYTNTGGHYVPSGDLWKPTSQGVNLPEARARHSAVWTGTEMIVWGGTRIASHLGTNTGGRYDPIGGSWAPTSITEDTPSARLGHSAVWTGTEMVVWGGYLTDTQVYSDSGARYFPSSDFWSAIPRAGAPTPRYGSRAVWTGSEMIVWGGNHGGDEMSTNVLSSGGRYCDFCASPTTGYRDADGDGYGSTSSAQPLCAVPAGWVTLGGDCDDANSLVHPGATEACNGIDDDCDDAIDDGIPFSWGSPTLTERKSGTSTELSWTYVEGASAFDITGGDLPLLLASGGDFTSSATRCLGNDWRGYSAMDSLTPPPGGGTWYVVRPADYLCGGSYDDRERQQGSRDGEIAASPLACP